MGHGNFRFWILDFGLGELVIGHWSFVIGNCSSSPHLLIPSPLHPLISSPPHLFTPSSLHLLIPSPPHLLTSSPPHPLTPSPPHPLTPSPPHPFTSSTPLPLVLPCSPAPLPPIAIRLGFRIAEPEGLLGRADVDVVAVEFGFEAAAELPCDVPLL